jgi:hypothetical protein
MLKQTQLENRRASIRLTLKAAFVGFLLAGCETSTEKLIVGQCEPDDTRVIAAAVQAMSGWPPAPVFESSVDLDAYADDLRKLDAADVPPRLIRSLLERNHASATIDPGTPAQFPLATAAREQTRQSIHVSLPGYSADGGAAVIYAGSACGPPCGQGGVVLLERSGDTWKVTTVVELRERRRRPR